MRKKSQYKERHLIFVFLLTGDTCVVVDAVGATAGHRHVFHAAATRVGLLAAFGFLPASRRGLTLVGIDTGDAATFDRFEHRNACNAIRNRLAALRGWIVTRSLRMALVAVLALVAAWWATAEGFENGSTGAIAACVLTTILHDGREQDEERKN